MKHILSHFVQTFGLTNINWSAQMMMLKKLLKTYSEEEIIFAIDYYSKQGVHMYSLGFLSKTMDKPLKEYRMTKDTKQWSDDSGTRNQRKFAEDNEAGGRTKHYLNLFEEPGQDN